MDGWMVGWMWGALSSKMEMKLTSRSHLQPLKPPLVSQRPTEVGFLSAQSLPLEVGSFGSMLAPQLLTAITSEEGTLRIISIFRQNERPTPNRGAGIQQEQ